MNEEFIIESEPQRVPPPEKPQKNRSWLIALIVIFVGLMLLVGLLVGLVAVASGGRGFSMGSSVGVVEITGVIVESGPYLDTLQEYREDENIKAVILRVDSPGGGVAATQEIYRELIRLSETKPVVASMGSIAASGGLYVAAAADTVLVNPGTITGSIGVIMELMNLEDLAGKVGLRQVVIKSGEFKDIGSSMRPMSDRERVILQGAVDRLHRQFVRDLAKGRGLDEAKVAALADGRIYMGEEAVELGLADQLGNFEDAVRLAGEKAGIEGRPRLVYPKKDEDWLSGLLAGKSPLGRFLPVWTRHPLTFQYLYVPGH